MFRKLARMLGGSDNETPALPVIDGLTIDRTAIIDALMLKTRSTDNLFELEHNTLTIEAQGLVDLSNDAESSYIHRFYTDDDVMIQILTSDPAGQNVTERSLFVPLASFYPSAAKGMKQWIHDLGNPSLETEDGTRFERAWFDRQDARVDLVTFWENIYDDREMSTVRRIFQRCMLFIREGDELLLAIIQEPESGDATIEYMIGIPLSPNDITT